MGVNLSLFGQTFYFLASLFIVFFLYFMYKYGRSKKMRAVSSVFFWVMAVLFILIGSGGFIISFFLFRSASLGIFGIIWAVLFAIFSLSFVFIGFMMILTALGVVKKRAFLARL